MSARPTDEEIRASFENWFAGTNPSSLDFSSPVMQKEFAYQAWKDARLTERQAARAGVK